jgi:hypothetical protein
LVQSATSPITPTAIAAFFRLYWRERSVHHCNERRIEMKVENPYLRPPQVQGPKSRSWALGFTYGFQGPENSSMAPADVQPEDADAFDEGVLVGQGAAINGMDLDPPCIDLNVERPTIEHFALEVGPSAVFFGMDAAGSLAGGVLGGIHLLFDIVLAIETFADDPSAGLNQGVGQLQERLQQLGFQQPLELYIGAGVDLNQPGCELQMTGIYRYQDGASNAARSMGRQQWLVAKWQTDRSGGATVVDAGGQ